MGNISTAVTTVKSDDVTTDLENKVRHRKQEFEWIGRKSRKETSILPYVAMVEPEITMAEPEGLKEHSLKKDICNPVA
ncbi:unnamed protein product [Timema podura]|uniref:Uncharacterized protein n=1 Tax=Timema podura TaxID=61482 RepID=A0ABN7P8V2_TIMPD|nr:unnamed protein product [Timema podura]